MQWHMCGGCLRSKDGKVGPLHACSDQERSRDEAPHATRTLMARASWRLPCTRLLEDVRGVDGQPAIYGGLVHDGREV
jgi:hypothetical protein